ncbi:hypothetical protein [Actinomadura sp. 9N407]|uniref:hypothetical protein n=1 Tax=Actinomadura sp. 9N407 TaxID=3375154 RepID=UPI00378C3285
MKISKYWKGVIAGAGPVLYAVQAAVTDSQVTTSEGITIGLAVLVALGVYAVPNRTAARQQ